MDYYKLTISSENKVWKKYFSFAFRFFYKDEEVKFIDLCINKKLVNLKIQALNKDGVVQDQSVFSKEKAPYFTHVQGVILIKDTTFNQDFFKEVKGIKFYTTKIDGKFENDYKLMSFTNVIDCIDNEKSIRNEFEFFSKLVLKKSKIPKDIDGFFLTGWNKFNQFNTVVNENLKVNLLKMEKASDFLIFNKIEISNED